MREAGDIRRSQSFSIAIIAAIAVVVFAVIAVVSSIVGATSLPTGEVRDDIVCDGADPDPPPPPGVQPPASGPHVPPPPEGFAESARRYDIEVTVEADGSARFTEQISYDFGPVSGARRGIFREILLRQGCNEQWDRVYRISDVTASSPTGAPADLTIEEEDNGVRLRVGNPDITVSGTHHYVIGYRIEGIVTPYPNFQELYWNVVGVGWSVPLYEVNALVEMPAPVTGAACYAGPPGSTTACSALGAEGPVAAFSQQLVVPGTNLTVAAAVPAGTTAAPTYFAERWSLARAFSLTPFTVIGSLVLLVLAVGAVAFLGFRIGRDRRAVGSHVDVAFAPAGTEGERVPLFGAEQGSPVEFEPPDGIRPAQMAIVLDETVTPRDVTATIVDLAVRGALRIEQLGEGRKADYQLVRLRTEDPTWLSYEMMLMNNLFAGTDGKVLLSSLNQTFSAKLKAVIQAVYADAVERQWFPRRPDKVRLAWRALGLVLSLLALAITAALAAVTHSALLGVPLVIGALALLLFAGRFPHRTAAGTGMFRRSLGFQRFIEDSEAPRARWAEQRNIFSEYLPYAIVMGEANRWARTFAPLGAEAVPSTGTNGAWFVGTAGFDAMAFNSATEGFTSSASSSLSSTPPSSSGSGSGGGGSSGGGGGGGGGGSW